jgi:hypothetical protein
MREPCLGFLFYPQQIFTAGSAINSFLKFDHFLDLKIIAAHHATEKFLVTFLTAIQLLGILIVNFKIISA